MCDMEKPWSTHIAVNEIYGDIYPEIPRPRARHGAAIKPHVHSPPGKKTPFKNRSCRHTFEKSPGAEAEPLDLLGITSCEEEELFELIDSELRIPTWQPRREDRALRNMVTE